MNWRLIFMLSLFGLAMAVATVYWIPSDIEPIFWLVIMIICAYLIAKNVNDRYFMHGFMVSIFNCIWITAAHFILYNDYIANHGNELEQYEKMSSASPRMMMLVIGPVIGIISGLVLGLFAWVASKITKKNPLTSANA